MVKTLFKLARNILFQKEFYCQYCDLIETNKEDMTNHIKNNHDEWGITIKIFYCKQCNETAIRENEIKTHSFTHIK